MTRREFSITLAGAAAAPAFSSRVLILHAIAGAHLPATLTVRAASPEKMRRGVWELRSYRGVAHTFASCLDAAFSRAGIHPAWRRVSPQAAGQDLTYFIPFDSLTARDRAWTLLNADANWTALRAAFQSYHFGLYRAL